MEILMAVAGALSIYLGYKLFCDLEYPENRMRHLASGALLALFGLGILIADVRGLGAPVRNSHRVGQRKSAEEGSFAPLKVNKAADGPEFLI